MAFTLPTLNLRCNVWHNQLSPIAGRPPGVPDIADAPCALAGRHLDARQALTVLMMPKGTDLRALGPSPPGWDIVEVPAGTGRLYVVYYVIDVGCGFPNEYRSAEIDALYTLWPLPYPPCS